MKKFFPRVLLLEEEEELFKRASKNNQARVHAGFHYPRSLLTAYRSQFNFQRFCNDFKEAIVDDFLKIYAVALNQSKVNAYQFYKRFKEMDCYIEKAPPPFRSLFNLEQIEEVFRVKEVVFDHTKLRDLMKERLLSSGVIIATHQKVTSIKVGTEADSLEVSTSRQVFNAKNVFNCTYSRISTLVGNSAPVNYKLKHEIAEVCLVALPPELEKVSMTVMDGPFFSVMPFPAENLHTLTHVRYTPHAAWEDGKEGTPRDPYEALREAHLESNFLLMRKDAERYVPLLREAQYEKSLYEVKTVLSQSESDDGRPILLRWNSGIPNVHTILGAKLDNIYDVQNLIEEKFT